MEPKKLSKEEKEELKKQFPKIEEYKHQRLQNKLEMIVIVFGMVMAIGTLYLFYLVWNYEFIGVW